MQNFIVEYLLPHIASMVPLSLLCADDKDDDKEGKRRATMWLKASMKLGELGCVGVQHAM